MRHWLSTGTASILTAVMLNPSIADDAGPAAANVAGTRFLGSIFQGMPRTSHSPAGHGTRLHGGLRAAINVGAPQ